MSIIPPVGLVASFSYLKKYISSDMGVSAGEVDAPMGNLPQRDLSAAAVRHPRGNAVNITWFDLVLAVIFNTSLPLKRQAALKLYSKLNFRYDCTIEPKCQILSRIDSRYKNSWKNSTSVKQPTWRFKVTDIVSMKFLLLLLQKLSMIFLRCLWASEYCKRRLNLDISDEMRRFCDFGSKFG